MTEAVRRRLDLRRHAVAVRALHMSTLVLSGGILAFALAPALPAALIALWVSESVRSVWRPIQRAWINQSLEPSTRATLFSIGGQADALGQIAAGPLLGLVARSSIPAALVVSALLLLPSLAVFRRLESALSRAGAQSGPGT